MRKSGIGKKILCTAGAIGGAFALAVSSVAASRPDIERLAWESYKDLKTEATESLFEQRNENVMTTVLKNGHYAITNRETGQYTFRGTAKEYLSLGLSDCLGSKILRALPNEDLSSVLDITSFQSEINGLLGHNYVVIQPHDKSITTSLIIIDGNIVMTYKELASQVNLSCENPFADAILAQKRLEKESFPGPTYRALDCCGEEITINWGIQDGKLLIHEVKDGKSTYMSVDYENQIVSVVSPDRTGTEMGYFDWNADGKLDAVIENEGNNIMVVRTPDDYATVIKTVGANCSIIAVKNSNTFLWRIRQDDYTDISSCLKTLVESAFEYQKPCNCQNN